MINASQIVVGKLISFFAKITNIGNGSTWPGHIALSINSHFIKDLVASSKTRVILIAGTNGKTTTSKLLRTILETNGKTVFQNESGANLLNGIASSLIAHASVTGRLLFDFAIFEVDENTLPLALLEMSPHILILLNIFRDQLDRYGETDAIASKWQQAIAALPPTSTLLLNADDPQIAFLGHQTKAAVAYFGLSDKNLAYMEPEHAADTLYCPRCLSKLHFVAFYFSHMGIWTCPKCHLKRPKPEKLTTSYPLSGIYNRYNTHAAVLGAAMLGVPLETIQKAIQHFAPAFGRQEAITFDGKRVKLFLSKNPTSLNESLRTIKDLGGKHLLFVLNDNIPDGRDVSWIWDVDFESFLDTSMDISASGERAFDMALRLKYAHPNVKRVDTYPLLENGIETTLAKVKIEETLFILPTYSAMLAVRKILTGKKIL